MPGSGSFEKRCKRPRERCPGLALETTRANMVPIRCLSFGVAPAEARLGESSGRIYPADVEIPEKGDRCVGVAHASGGPAFATSTFRRPTPDQGWQV